MDNTNNTNLNENEEVMMEENHEVKEEDKKDKHPETKNVLEMDEEMGTPEENSSPSEV